MHKFTYNTDNIFIGIFVKITGINTDNLFSNFYSIEKVSEMRLVELIKSDDYYNCKDVFTGKKYKSSTAFGCDLNEEILFKAIPLSFLTVSQTISLLEANDLLERFSNDFNEDKDLERQMQLEEERFDEEFKNIQTKKLTKHNKNDIKINPNKLGNVIPLRRKKP